MTDSLQHWLKQQWLVLLVFTIQLGVAVPNSTSLIPNVTSVVPRNRPPYVIGNQVLLVSSWSMVYSSMYNKFHKF